MGSHTIPCFIREANNDVHLLLWALAPSWICWGGEIHSGLKTWPAQFPVVPWQEEVKASQFSSVQFSSVAQSCLTLCDPMNRSMPGLPVHHQLPEFTKTYVHWVSDAIKPSHPLSSPSPPAPNPSQHQSLFQWVNSSQRWPKYWSFSFSIIPSKASHRLLKTSAGAEDKNTRAT